MANTVIAIRSSGTAAATPSLGVIANGELSLNYADGILYYKTTSNTLGSIRTTQPAGLTTEIQFNDAGSFGSNSGVTFDKSTGYFKAPIIESTNNGNGTNFKVGDDIWIGDVNVADTLRLTGQQNVNNAYIIFGASDSSKLGRSGTGALTYSGSFVATGELSTLNSVGDEGGQINFGLPQTNTTLNSGVVVDVYQNKLRFYESGGTNRGAYIDLTAASASVATNLLSGGGAVTSVAGATGAVSNNQILAGLLTVDGSGSGLDADLLDGLDSSSFANAAFANTDYTTISATATTYGNAAYIPVTTLAANGRVSSIVNTAIAISTTQITSGVLPFAQGGANATSYTTGAFLTSNGTAFVSVANTGTAGTYGNAAYHPVITTDAYGRVSAVTNTLIQIATTQITSGVLPFAQGGTNAASYTTGTLLTSNGTAIISLANTGTAGTYGNAAYVPVVTTDAYGRVSSVTNTAISITSAAVSGLATSATTDTTNATNITSGTLGAARLPTVGTAGTYGNAAYVPVITTDAYGRVTSVTNTAISSSGATLGDVLALSIALG